MDPCREQFQRREVSCCPEPPKHQRLLTSCSCHTQSEQGLLTVGGLLFLVFHYDAQLPQIGKQQVPVWIRWVCHKDTRAGDLVLLYRTGPKSDIAYLLRAEKNASPIMGSAYATKIGWTYECTYRSLYYFETTLTYRAMVADPDLRDWPALRDRFQRTAWPIPATTFEHLSKVLGRMCPGSRKVFADAD